MIGRNRVVHQSHDIVAARVRPGDIVVDATAGNGHDTRFLCELVGSTGIVYACDIQPSALANTRALVAEHAPGVDVRFIEQGHQHIATWVDPAHHGQVTAVMFNLGYLPGSDKTVTTQAQSTVRALESAVEALRPDGILAIVCYPGHQAGAAESAAVLSWAVELNAASGGRQVTGIDRADVASRVPFLIVVDRAPTP